ncbi:MAG TPA: M14 family zinc carboxypeptidase [Thermoanaerobaculia bacterium]|nr:M14 family zinc carboxypeptidase [Thermoanaerobaculia bacterium]
MKHVLLVLTLLASIARAADDAEYTRQIREYTTGPQFTTELVDHLPASERVPSPLKFFGHVAGADGFLTYSEDVNRYMRALEAASPRVKVVSVGKSEEGREMIAVAIASDETIASLDRYRDATRRLADPRKLSDDEARRLIAEGKPIYYATGAIHSPETGSPEMLMELAYRLAVEETPFIRNIRDNVITLITPVLEVDGRDRQVDLWRYRQANPSLPTPPLIYWGHYVAHDKNRDYLGLALALSRNVLKAYFDFHPQVIHDLHESVPFLYISTGTGPYNASLDPIVVDEWQRLAWHEVQEMTSRGVPGVWTYGFYDGWAPNYMIWTGQGHNTVGRFYETFGNRWPITAERIVRGQSERAWFRPNPPLPKVTWSLRNNVNYQQSALLFGLEYVAENRQHFLEQFWTLGKRAVAKATTEGPAAWAFDGAQKRRGNLHNLLTLLQTHGVEVSVLDAPFEKLPAGSFVVRMDQPYSRLADAVLDTQYVRGEERVYDDTGWTLGYLKNVDFKRVVDPAVLKVPMHLWDGKASAPATPANAADIDFFKNKKFPRIAVMHTWLRTQDEGWYRLALESMNVPYTYISTQDAARTPNLREKFDVILFPPTGTSNASTDIVNGLPPGPPLPWKKTPLTPNLGVDETDDMRPGLGMTGVANVQRFVEEGGLLITARDTAVWAVQYGLARWVRTIEPQKLKAPGTILLANVVDKKSPIGAGYDENVPVYFSGGPIFDVGIRLGGPGDQPPPGGEQRPSGRGGKTDPDVPQGRPYVPLPERPKPAPGEEGFQLPEDAPWNVDYAMPRAEDRPRVIVAFAKPADKLLLSGMLEGGDELAGKAVVIDAPRGKGHIVLFANNPMWRANTQGSYALVMNAILNWDALR